MNENRARLYLITPPAFELAAFSRALSEALAAGDVAAVQLRLKDMPDADIVRIGAALKPIVQAAGAAFILNDRPDLALKLDADGVHVGQQDAPYEQARALLGKNKIVGVTCHDSYHLAMEAGEAGADYVAFGAFFPTSTKHALTRAPLSLLEDWTNAMEVPCVAIGGINVDNCEPLVRAGADFLAVSAGVWAYPLGVAEAVKRFNALFARVARQIAGV